MSAEVGPLERDVWRQVSEHAGIDVFTEALRERVARDLPLQAIRVLSLDRAGSALEPLACAPWADDGLHAVPLVPAILRDLTGWILQGDVEPLAARTFRALQPVGPYRPLLAGGLADGGDPVGLVVFDGPRALEGHLPALRALLAPLVVALRNHRRLLELARLREAVEAENRALLTRLERDGLGGAVVGADSGLREVMTRIQQVSQTTAPVLLLGETGTGKELIAREVHLRSPRARGPFLKVNCGAIPSELIDSELFGHAKGSFTGAVGERRGWFERADGGTLFLDEVGELPAAAQVRLLRVLQDGVFERVGGERPLHADVRVVAATHRDLQEMVAEGRFRQDLWYRICVFPVHLPPLRERLRDVEALGAHFAARAGMRLHGRALTLDAADLRLLTSYPWPGNVRELASVIERAAILGDGSGLAIRAALGVFTWNPSSLRGPEPGDVEPAGSVRPVGPSGALPAPSRAPTLEEVNRQAIVEALQDARGQIEGSRGVAARLGLSPSTLRSRMKRLGVDWRDFRA